MAQRIFGGIGSQNYWNINESGAGLLTGSIAVATAAIDLTNKELLEEILVELKIMNTHLSFVTDNQIGDDDKV